MTDYETIFKILKKGKFPAHYTAFCGTEYHCGKTITIKPQTVTEEVNLEFDEDGNFVGFG